MMTNTESLESLNNFLRIPSITADPAHKPDILHAAQFCTTELRQAGLTSVELIESEQGWNPLVYAWTSPPFEPTARGDKEDDLGGRRDTDSRPPIGAPELTRKR